MINKNIQNTTYTKLISNFFKLSFEKEWYESYWAIDVHRTIIKPSYDLDDKTFEYYPYAKETLQLLTKRKDIILILWTSSYQADIDFYNEKLLLDGIVFNNINENPDISSNNGNFGFYDKKFYFNILFDDKAGFDANNDWKPIYDLLIEYEKTNYLPNPNWNTKY